MHVKSLLSEQIAAVESAAAQSQDPETQSALNDAAKSLLGEAARIRNSLRSPRAEGPVSLPENASNAELRRARSLKAIARGKDIFLPVARNGHVALPNLLLRSALFSAGTITDEPVTRKAVAVHGDASIFFSGLPLNDYDRRVFAACLSFYQQEIPLGPINGAGDEITASLFQIAGLLGVSYGTKVRSAIRASIRRLNAAKLQLRQNGRDISFHHLLQATIEDGEGRKGDGEVVRFRIDEQMANLFGAYDWSAVHTSALHDFSGLSAWLAVYYSTHAKPFPTPTENLWRFSGMKCPLSVFKRKLKMSLAQLQHEETPEPIRVKEALFSAKEDHVTVKLCRWKDKPSRNPTK